MIEKLNIVVVVIWTFRSFVCMVLFLKLATKWPKLMKNWSEVEMFMFNMKSPPKMRKRIIYSSLVFFILGAGKY